MLAIPGKILKHKTDAYLSLDIIVQECVGRLDGLGGQLRMVSQRIQEVL